MLPAHWKRTYHQVRRRLQRHRLRKQHVCPAKHSAAQYAHQHGQLVSQGRRRSHISYINNDMRTMVKPAAPSLAARCCRSSCSSSSSSMRQGGSVSSIGRQTQDSFGSEMSVNAPRLLSTPDMIVPSRSEESRDTCPFTHQNRQSSQCLAVTQLLCEAWARWGHLSSIGPQTPPLAASSPAYRKLPYTVCGSTLRGAACSRVGASLGLSPVGPWDCLTTERECYSDRHEYAVCCRCRQRQAGQGSCYP